MPNLDRATDTELTAAFGAGDRDAFTAIFDRYADHIYSYCLAMVGDRDLAEDAATDAFLVAAARLKVERPERLRPWLFRLARDEARENGGGVQGVIGDDQASAGFDDERDDLRHLVLEAVDGLGERDRQLMILHLVESLDGDDLAEAIGGDPSDLDVVVERMRSRVEGAVGPVLLTRLGNRDCAELASLLDEWSGRFDGDVRSAVSRHLGGCVSCRERRALLLSPASALPGILLVSAPSSLRQRVLDGVEASGADVDPAPPAASPAPEWVSVAAFVGVSVVLGLIGVAVSARYEPLSPISAPSTFIAGPGSTTTSVFASATTTPGGPGTTVTPSAPASIEVSAVTIDFGADGSSAAFELSNVGGQPAQWTAAASSEAILLSSGQGELAPGATATLEVALDRGVIAEGDLAETITITWDGGETSVAAVGTHEDNPIIHDPQASPASLDTNGGGQCSPTQTTVSARVRDTSALEMVVARWSPDGSTSRETSMDAVGNDIYEGVIGPFTSAGAAEVRVVAFDERGNAGGASVTVNVVACP